MKWLSAALLISLISATLSFKYDATPMEDPLQPIWDRLDSMSQEILDGFQKQMTGFVHDTQANIETRFQELKAGMNNTGSGSSRRDDNALVSQVTDAVSGWIEYFYEHTISTDNNNVVTNSEGTIKVRIEALENKLIEHINVKMAALTTDQSAGRNASESAAVLPAGTKFTELETKITNHITTKLTDIENSVSAKLSSLAETMVSSSSKLSSINTHVTKITEELAEGGVINRAGSGGTSADGSPSVGSGESCEVLVNKVSAMVNGSHLSTDFLEQQERRWMEMQSVIAEVRDTPSYLPRDCSDIHWLHHEALSGVYQIYPTLHQKNSIFAWCNMGENGDKADGGWTVILRRRETDFGHLDFNRTWKEYANGFGDPAEGEWWFSLTALHSLTYRQPYSIRFLMTAIEDGHFYANYKSFRVEDEAHNFRLIVDGFTGNVSLDAFKSKHHGMSFSTPDVDNDNWEAGSCGASNSGGWWFNACHYTTLTSKFPTSSDREAKTIRWMGESGEWMVLNDVTVMIRPINYAARFDAHGYEK